MPRNKKNKNRAVPTHQAANAPAVNVPTKPTENPPSEAPTQIPAVVANSVADQSNVSLAAAIVEPKPAAVIEAKPMDAPVAPTSGTVAEKTSDDDETAGMSKSQKKKKNKNKNKGNKFGPETNVTLEESKVAAKVEPEKEEKKVTTTITPVPVEKAEEKIIDNSTEPIIGKFSSEQHPAAVNPACIESIDAKPDDSKKKEPESVPVQHGKSKNKKNKNKNKNDVICEEYSESLDIIHEDNQSKVCDMRKDEPVNVKEDPKGGVQKRIPEEKPKAEEEPKADMKPKAEEKLEVDDEPKVEDESKAGVKPIEDECLESEKKSEACKSENKNKAGNKKKSHENVKTDEKPKAEAKDDSTLKNQPKSDNISAVEKIPKVDSKDEPIIEEIKTDVKPKVGEKKKQDNKPKHAQQQPKVEQPNKAANKAKAVDTNIDTNCEPLETIKTPTIATETKEKVQQQAPAKDLTTTKKLPSTVTQPKQSKPACPTMNPIIPNPDIASIWKILDPPKDDNENKTLAAIPLSGISPSIPIECKATEQSDDMKAFTGQSEIMKTSLSVLPQVLSTQFIATPIIADAIATSIDAKPIPAAEKDEPSKIDTAKCVESIPPKKSDGLNIEKQKSIIDDILSKMSEPTLSEPMIPIKMAANCPSTHSTTKPAAVVTAVQQPAHERDPKIAEFEKSPNTTPITKPTPPIVASAKLVEATTKTIEVVPSQPAVTPLVIDVLPNKTISGPDSTKLIDTANPNVSIPVTPKKVDSAVPQSVPIKNKNDTENISTVKVDIKPLVVEKPTATPDKQSTDPQKPIEATQTVVADTQIPVADDTTHVDEPPIAPPKKSTTKTDKATKVKTATVSPSAAKEKTVKDGKIKTSDKSKVSASAEKPVKEPKTKTTKTKAKAPAPPNKDEENTAKAIITTTTDELTAAAAQSLSSASTSNLADPVQPSASTDPKNAPGSDSAQSVDVSAIIGSGSAESLRTESSANDTKDVSITAEVILSNDVNASFTIPATKSAKVKPVPVEVKKPPVEVQKPTAVDPKTDAKANDVQLLDLLTNTEKTAGVKAGTVAGNVRTKTPAKVATAGTANVAKTSAEPKANKPGSPVKDVVANKPVNKSKQPSPPKDVASTSTGGSPASKSAARSAKTPPRNPTTGPTTAASKSRNSPPKEKSPAAANTKPTIQPRPTKTFDKKSTPPPSTATATNNNNQRSASSSSSRASNSSNSPSPNPPYDDDEYVEFKFSPRPVYMSTICQVCKIPLAHHVHCKQCLMVSYCSVEHMTEDADGHQPLCKAIQEIAKKRGGHVYNNARILNDDDYRSLRVHTLNLCENALQRHLQPFEREILLFPRLCATGTCREWRQQLLAECKTCGQVSYCAEHVNHLGASHARWCQAFALYQKLVFTQKKYGRIEPSLPSKIMTKPYQLPATMDETFKSLYKNYGAIKEDCTYAALTQLATAPLTAYYGMQRADMATPIGERFTIHLVGAELQFEADTLDKWETFFLHLVPQLLELRVTFVGPELNAENLPLEILSRIRMCRACRQNCRAVKFDFQCGMLYHNYVASSAFAKPDLICFFNPGLYRATGFNGIDTWPETIRAAAAQKAPIIVTSYTEVESPRDLERLQREAGAANVGLVLAPHVNPFSSQRPERNFISDEVAPMIFKNYYCFVCK